MWQPTLTAMSSRPVARQSSATTQPSISCCTFDPAWATPCKTLNDVFTNRDFRRIDVLRDPGASRLYAKVLRDGVVRAGDTVRVRGDNAKVLPFRVTGLSNDPALLGQWTVTRTDAAKLQRQPTDFLIGLTLDKGVSLDAVRADLLHRLGHDDESRAAYDAAIALTTNPAERDLLIRRRP